MSLQLDKSLYFRYLNDECSEEEREIVESWMHDPRYAAVLREWMREHWNTVDHSPPDERLSAVWAGLHERIEREAPVVPMSRRSTKRTFAVAASVAIIAAAAALVYRASDRAVPTRVLEASDVITRVSDERDSLILPDGSTVWLNAQTKLQYPPGFARDSREIYLEGEAFFDVVHDPSRPFIVYTRDIAVRVLGTAFTVKAYDGDRSSETTLLRGSVIVERQGLLTTRRTELVPNERLVFERSNNEVVVTSVDADDYAAWRRGTLHFDNEPIDNVVRTLERWYGVDIVAPAQPSGCGLTAHLENESLPEMLDLLQSSTGISYRIDGSRVILEGKLCE